MDFNLLKYDIRNNTIINEINEKYNELFTKRINVIALKQYSQTIYNAYNSIRLNKNINGNLSQYIDVLMNELKDIAEFNERKYVEIARNILVIVVKFNYLARNLRTVEQIIHNDNTSLEMRNLIEYHLLSLADYYLINKRMMTATRIYYMFDNDFKVLREYIYDAKFYYEIDHENINDDTISKLVSIYNDIVYEADLDDINEKIVNLSDRYIKLYLEIVNDINLHSFRLIFPINQTVSKLSFLSNLYYYSKNRSDYNFNVDIDLLIYLFEISSNEKLLTIYKLIDKKETKKDLYDIYNYVDELLLIESIKKDLRMKIKPKDYVYYTRIENLAYMFPEKILKDSKQENNNKIGRLSFMHYAYMNDPKEGMPLIEYITGEKDKIDKYTYPYVFMKCFTPRKDDIPMWEIYGDRACGCCVVIDWKKLLENNNDLPLYKVCYIKDSKAYLLNDETGKMEENEDIVKKLNMIRDFYSKTKKVIFLQLLDEIRYLFKNIEYKHEEEIRIIYFHNEETNKFHYTDDKIPKLFIYAPFYTYIERIIIGPKCQQSSNYLPYLQKQLYEMNKHIEYNEKTEIEKSKVNYR